MANTFPGRLRYLREGRGLSMVQLADLAGLHHAAISRYESGLRSPTWDAVQRLAKALGVSTEELREGGR